MPTNSNWDCYHAATDSVLGKEPRAVTYVQKALGRQLNVTPEPNFNTRDIVSVIIGRTRVINVYHQPKPGEYEGALVELRRRWEQDPRNSAVVAGDFNLRHTVWEDLDYTPAQEACSVVQWFTEQGFVTVSPRNKPTRVTESSSTVIDIVMAKAEIADKFFFEEHADSLSDHLQLDWKCKVVKEEPSIMEEETKLDYDGMREEEWSHFQEVLSEAAKKVRKRHITTDHQIDVLAEEITSVILTAMKTSARVKRIAPQTKRWWTDYIQGFYDETMKARRTARKDPTEENKDHARGITNQFHYQVRVGKAALWQNYLESLQGGGIWRAAKYCQTTAQPNTLPALRKQDGSWATGLAEKADALEGGLFPPPPPSESSPEDYTPEVDENWGKLDDGELYVAIDRLNPKKAPGPDTLKAKAIKQAYKNEDMQPHLLCLYAACTERGYQPLAWRASNTVVLRKGGKRDSAEPKSYRPISLLNVMGKVLETIIQRRLSHITRNTLPKEQYGGRSGYSAPDAVLKLVQDAQLANKRKDTRTTAMMVDVKGAFDKVHRDTLLSTLETLKVPKTAIRWVCSFLTGRTTSLVIDGKTLAPREVQVGIPQGSPISPLLFLLHTTPLYKVIKSYGAEVIGYIDDITVYCHGRAGDNLAKLRKVLEGIHSWADHHHMAIDYGDKLGLMHLGRKGRDTKEGLHLPTGDIRFPQKQVKLLGITLDTNMNFKAHIDRALELGAAALGVTQRLAGRVYGVTGEAARCLYTACVLPVMEYGLEVWHHKLTRDKEEKARKMQNRAARIILGAARSTPISALYMEAALAPIDLRWESAIQKKTLRQMYRLNPNNPVQHLETGENTCWRDNRWYLPKEVPRTKVIREDLHCPPWIAYNDMGEEDVKRRTANEKRADEYLKLLQLINRNRMEALQEWYDSYETSPRNDPKGEARPACPAYRKLLPKARLKDKVLHSTLSGPLRSAPRPALSLIVQMRTGHFRGAGLTPKCGCGLPLSTDHIMKHCIMREQARNRLIRTALNTSVEFLLSNPKGHGDLIAFLSAPLQYDMFEQ